MLPSGNWTEDFLSTTPILYQLRAHHCPAYLSPTNDQIIILILEIMQNGPEINLCNSILWVIYSIILIVTKKWHILLVQSFKFECNVSGGVKVMVIGIRRRNMYESWMFDIVQARCVHTRHTCATSRNRIQKQVRLYDLDVG